jgi:hypothetical protein
VLETVYFELGQQKSQFRISMQTPVENPLMTIENFNRQLQIGEEEIRIIDRNPRSLQPACFPK